MNLRQAAQQALAALVWEVGSCPEMYAKQTAEAITALRAALAEADEPVAWFESPYGEVRVNPLYKFQFPSSLLSWQIPLYTRPPRREPLTDEQVDALAIDTDGLPASHIELARAVERAHGIGTDE